MDVVKIGILGLGTVGSGTVNLLIRNSSEISRRLGRKIEILSIADRNFRKLNSCNTEGFVLTTNAHDIVCDPRIQCVVELIGGTETAYELVLEAISNGKHVVTANKALIAMHGNELFAKAHKKGVSISFEAAVAGSIPIIKSMREGLSGNEIEWLAGIINGTCNFILTEMCNKGRDFADVLAEAQKLGYAESDPTFDINGIDAAHKLTIMSSIAFGMPLRFDKVYIEGISKITQEDVCNAAELGYIIKHLGIARRAEKGVQLRVHPTLISHHTLIANVDGVMNSVFIQSDSAGSTLYYGAGAGSDATASAVVADISDIARTLIYNPYDRVPYLSFQQDTLVDKLIMPISEVITSYYLRVNIKYISAVSIDIMQILVEQGIGIKMMLQKQSKNNDSALSLIILTRQVMEKYMNIAITQIEALTVVENSVMRIRIESF